MKVLYVYQGDWPRNAVRVRKQTQALAEAGHEIRLLCANPHGKPRFSAEPWMEVERIPKIGPPPLNGLLSFPIPVNPLWLLWIIRAARSFAAESVVVTDLPLAPLVLAAGRVLGLPMHYEMSDIYPVVFRGGRDAHPRLTSRIIRRPKIAEWFDKLVIRNADSVFVVSDESRQRCLDLGADPEAAVLVGNTPDVLPDLDDDSEPPADIADWAGRPLVVFLGNLLPDRGLDVAVDAVALAREALPEIGLMVIGDGPEQAELVTKVRENGLDSHVRLLGWKDHTEHAAYYRLASIGILPFLPTEHVKITLANKLFDYMAAALAVVATDVPPMRRVLEETDAGILVKPEDPRALADALVQLLRDPERTRRLGERGRAAVEGPYSWSADKMRFLEAVARPHAAA